MRSKASAFLFVLLPVFSLIVACPSSGGAWIHDPDGAYTLFQPDEGLFQARIPAEYSLQKEDASDQTVYRFSSRADPSEDGDVSEEMTISFRLKKPVKKQDPADLFSTGYESKFIKECKCVILERGAVNFQGKPARYYHLSFPDSGKEAYQVHFIEKDGFLVIAGVRGVRSRSSEIKNRFDLTMDSIKSIKR